MFYNHTILTSRDHGVAVVWLVATLGSQTSSKKISRKSIQDVNVHQACQTIQSTQAPLALRLQGNLLFGVASVHSRQCGYVLADLRAMRDKIRGVALVLEELGLDPEAGKARPDQLNLPYDPAFLPDLDFNFDFPALGSVSGSSSRSSLMSPSSLVSSQSSMAEESDDQMEHIALELPSHDSSIGADYGGMQLAPSMSPGLSSGAVIPGHFLAMDEDSGIVDAGFEVDPDGNLVDFSEPQGPDPPTTKAPETPLGAAAPWPAVSAASQSDIGVGAQASSEAGSSFDFDDGLLAFGDEERLSPSDSLPPADALEMEYSPPSSPADEAMQDVEISSTVVTAPQRRTRGPKTLGRDERPELTNAELRQWNEGYLENMDRIAIAKIPFRAVHQAKKNALYWVIEHGIGGVGARLGDDRVVSPLHMFSGDPLLASLMGRQASTAGKKHARSSSSDNLSEEERRVRPRGEDEQQIGRGGSVLDLDLSAQDEGIIIGDDDPMEIEVGRDAPPNLGDDRSSMPWDTYSYSRAGSSVQPGSAAAGGISSSIGGAGRGFDPTLLPSSLSRRGSRLTSASPLQGRGLPLSHRISILSTPEGARRADLEGDSGDDEMLLGGLDDASADFQLPDVGGMDDDAANDGSGGQDTEQQRWGVAAALDSDTLAFLDFLDAKIQQQRIEFAETAQLGSEEEKEEEEEADEQDPVTRQQASPPTTTTFSALLPPSAENTDKNVAAAAFLHVLSLASKNLVHVRQDNSEAESGFGEIELGIMIEA